MTIKSILPFLFLFLFVEKSVATNTPIIRVAYFNKPFGHVHQAPSRHSSSFTTISCGHPIKILGQKRGSEMIKVFANRWRYVKVGSYKGYIEDEFISNKKKKCFQDKYPYFFDQLNLKIEDLYYWGRLYDQYVMGKSERP